MAPLQCQLLAPAQHPGRHVPTRWKSLPTPWLPWTHLSTQLVLELAREHGLLEQYAAEIKVRWC